MLLKTTIDRIEKDQAILITEDNESITWPLSKLPKGTAEGDNLQIKIIDSKGSDKGLAKELLNEILDV